jgi:hypothetical protein
VKGRIIILIFGIFLVQTLNSQMNTNYTVGVNSLGDYGMRIDRGNEYTKLSFAYSSINSLNSFSNKVLFLNQSYSSNVGMFGMTYEKRKPLTSRLDLFYGSEVNMLSNIYKNTNLSANPNGTYLPNLSLNVGMNYKFNDNISISATYIQGYGYGLGYTFGRDLFFNGYPGFFNKNNW